jgi:Tat protein secretion system quality control protein TatD with DNase activity
MASTEKRCHRCGKVGHLANKCSSGKTKNLKCHICGKGGHLRSECPGIEDDGVGQSKFKGKSAPQSEKKKQTHNKRERSVLFVRFCLIALIHRGQKKDPHQEGEQEYAAYPIVTIRYLDFHCAFNSYPSSLRELAVFDEEIRLDLFLGAILSVPLDPIHLLFPEDVLEEKNHHHEEEKRGALYLLGVPPSCAMTWLQSLQVESLFVELNSPQTEDPLARLMETHSLDQLELVLRKSEEDREREEASLPLAAALRVGRVYLESLLRRHERVVVGMGPIGLDYTDLYQEVSAGVKEETTETALREQQLTRWVQCLVLHLQLSVLLQHCRGRGRALGESCGESCSEEKTEALPPPVGRESERSGEWSEGETEEEEETASPDPLLSILSGDRETPALPRYALLSLVGPSSLICRDLISVLSSLTLPTPGPYLLIQLSSASLTHRTIQYLLATYPSTVFFTVDGRLTHSKQKLLREFVFDIPLERLVLESNGPLFPTVAPPSYSDLPLPPVPAPEDYSPSVSGNGRRQRGRSLSQGGVGAYGGGYHPGHLLVIAATIASIKRLDDTDSVLDVLWTNTCRILGLSSFASARL